MIIYGKQVCLYAMANHGHRIKRIYIQKAQALSYVDAHHMSKTERIDARKAQALSKNGNHQGILVEMDEPELTPLSDLKREPWLVVLDGLTDVGNIGAIVRTAYALGVDGIVVTGIRQLPFAGVVRTSAGALLDMPVALIQNVADVLQELKDVGFVCYGAAVQGESAKTMVYAPKRVLVLGSEGAGLSKKAQRKIDRFVTIPMKRPFDSLNVNAAAAILLDRMSDGTS